MKIVAAEEDTAVGQGRDVIEIFIGSGIVADTTGTTGITNIKYGQAAYSNSAIQDIYKLVIEHHLGGIPTSQLLER